MTTTVINLKDRIGEFGQRLERAPASLVYVGRANSRGRARGGWDLPQHPLNNPPKNSLKRLGTPEAAVAAYCRHLLANPELLGLVPALRGKTLGCWCAPDLCHAHILAALADRPADQALEYLAEREADLETAAELVETALFARLA